MKRALAAGFALVAVGLLATGCATIIKGTTEPISITCNVEGAKIILEGREIGVTPFYGEIPKNKKSVQIVKEGYQTETVALSSTIQGWFFGNVIFGGTFGSTTDFATGAAFTYSPATYQVELRANSQSLFDYQRQLVVKKFSMLYMDEISQDLAVGDGEYLSALVRLLDQEEDHAASIARIRAAFESSRGDQVRFGIAAVALL